MLKLHLVLAARSVSSLLIGLDEKPAEQPLDRSWSSSLSFWLPTAQAKEHYT
jgi:hypothetical protein